MPNDELAMIESEHHPAAQKMLDGVAAFEKHGHDVTDDLLIAIVRREAHLCTARFHEMKGDGLPYDTAEMLAQDDMGFQLAKALADSLV